MTALTASPVLATKPLQHEITSIWIHQNPDIDEIIAIWIAKTFGHQRFPGIDSADVYFADPAEVEEKHASLIEEGVLCIGFGGGPFDEHPEDGDDGQRVHNECAASLVARALGVRNKPGVIQAVDYAMSKDHSSDTKRFELGLMVKMAFRYLPGRLKDEEQQEAKANAIMEAAFIFLDGLYAQVQAREQCLVDIEKSYRDSFFTKPRGGLLRVGSVVTENLEMNKMLRTRKGKECHVVIQRQPDGHNQLFFDRKQAHPDMAAVVVMYIRIGELMKKGLPYAHLPNSVLMSDGAIEGAEEWYFEKAKTLILNGCPTQSRPPSKLSRDEVEAEVTQAILSYYEGVRRNMEQREQEALRQEETVPYEHT